MSDSISFVKSKKSIWISQKGKFLSFRKLVKIIKNNPEALIEIKKARRLKYSVSAISWTSCILFGLTLQGLLNQHYENAIPVGASVIFIISSIPISQDITYHTEKAIHIYNQSLK